MYFSVLGSGSRGNSVFIEAQGTTILIDAGFSGKEIERRLAQIGKTLDDLDAICVTHEHNDHIAGVGVLSRRCKIPVIANVPTFRRSEKKIGKPFKVMEFDTGDVVAFQDLQIRSFRISHDTADPVGYVVSDGVKQMGYCTDTGKVTHLMAQRLGHCNGLVLEFNHDPHMLQQGPYPLHLQQRIRSNMGHLANAEAAQFVRSLQHPGLTHVVLAHLSETNNHPDIALKEARNIVSRDKGCQLHLSRQEKAGLLLGL